MLPGLSPGLECSVCKKKYKLGEVFYRCPACNFNLVVQYDYDGMGKFVKEHSLDEGLGMFRYMPFLPLKSTSTIPPLSVGNTPLYETPRLAKELGLEKLYIKDESRNPTGSLKDRASALVVAMAKSEGRDLITTASTGNAGAALAGISASAGIKALILVPKTAPAAKIAQLQVYGAQLCLVDGSYDDAFELCEKVAMKNNWYCRNTGANPFTSEGKKTVSLEICEQLASKENVLSVHSGKVSSFKAPDYIFVSVGDGNIITGVFRGLEDLYKSGLIDKIPHVCGVQSTKSNSIASAWSKGISPVNIKPINANTRADSIAADLPSDAVNATRAVTESKGFFIEVEDEEILSEIPVCSRNTGVFPEPAAACAVAGLRKAAKEGKIPKDAEVVCIITGSGLKDIPAAMSVCPAPNIVKKDDVEEVEKIAGKKLSA